MTANPKKPPKRPWEAIAQDAQALRDRSLDKVEPSLPEPPKELPKNVMDIPDSILDSCETSITTSSVEKLLSALRSRGGDSLSAVEVCNAFLRRAALAQKLTNCITELLPERALKRAAELDAHLESTGKPVGVLHGLPISVKEHIGIAGHRLHASYVALWDNFATEDAHIIKILQDAGAIPYARTTQPQTIMHLETDSNLYGVTVNPYNSDLTAGGSSGGEGALVGMRGSSLGIGTDVGGSIRSPAANNGVYGLKPTSFRLPTDGWSSIAAAVDEIPTCIGPLSTSLHGIETFMKTVLDAKPWLSEPALLPLPWHADFDPSARPLRIAILWHDDVVKPHPPVTRALQSVAKRLNMHKNIRVTDWKPHLHDEAWAIICSLYYPDGGAEDLNIMKSAGEPVLPLSKWMLKDNPCVKEQSIQSLQYWKEEREAYRKEYAQHWNQTAEADEDQLPVDAILCPVGPGCAPKHDTSKYWCYTSQWNLLDYPGLVFPVLKADKNVDIKPKDFKPMSDKDEENWELYDPDTFDGVPVSLQLVTRRCEDEKVVSILKYLEKEIGLPLDPFP